MGLEAEPLECSKCHWLHAPWSKSCFQTPQTVWGLKMRKTFKAQVNAHRNAGYLAIELIEGHLWAFHAPPNTFGENGARVLWDGKKWPPGNDLSLSKIYWHADGRAGEPLSEQEASKRLKVESTVRRRRQRLAETREKAYWERRGGLGERARGDPLHLGAPWSSTTANPRRDLERRYDRLVSAIWAGVEVEEPCPYTGSLQVYIRENLH